MSGRPWSSARPPGVLQLPMVRTHCSISWVHGGDASPPATSGSCAPSTTTCPTCIRPPPRSSVLFNGGTTSSCCLLFAARRPTRAATSSSSPHDTRPVLLHPRHPATVRHSNPHVAVHCDPAPHLLHHTAGPHAPRLFHRVAAMRPPLLAARCRRPARLPTALHLMRGRPAVVPTRFPPPLHYAVTR
jgi:hypothetical protein